MKKLLILILSLIVILTLIACTGNGGDETTGPDSGTAAPSGGEELDEQLKLDNLSTVTVDTSKTHQTIESFGASGCWWSQVVGGNEKTREKIAKLLFDDEEGIGLNSYRYNIGAGSKDAGSKSAALITDINRRTYSFETDPGVYDWDRDANAVWFMRKAVELGVDEIVMFCNSPLERLTKNGMAAGDPGFKTNIAPENYAAFAKYVLDVAAHFKEEGLPIKYVSPINEPAFEWAGGQEGCHYEDAEVVACLRAFVEAIEARSDLEGVEISGPEGSSWRNVPGSRYEDDTLGLCLRIMKDDVLGNYFQSLDAHSYWSTTAAKTNFANHFRKQYPNIRLRETEWCEMTTGDMKNEKDPTIESGIVLAKQVHEDMTILDCVSWSFWTAVSFGDYRDGLIYTEPNGTSTTLPKRYYTLGQYSKYIDRGYVRVDCTSGAPGLSVSAYTGKNEDGVDEIVLVFINEAKGDINIDFSGIDTSKFTRITEIVTSKSRSMKEMYHAEFLEGTAVTIPTTSVTTVIISGK